LSAYRQARQAIAAAYRLTGAQRTAALLAALYELEYTLQDIGRGAMAEALQLGIASAEAQIAAYTAAGVPFSPAREHAALDALTAGWASATSAQLGAAKAMATAGAEQELLLGGADRLGVVQPAPVLREGARWLAMATAGGFQAWTVGVEPQGELLGWQRLAVAAVDGRTTDCCLRVNGQVVNGVDVPFILTGEPRFADRLVDPPFHMHCRTSVVLYMEQYDDGATGFLKEQSAAEQDRRRVIDEKMRDVKVKLVDREKDPTARKYKSDDTDTRKLRRELKRLQREREQGSANIPWRAP